MQTNFSDAQIDAAARQYAFKNKVSYSEALTSVMGTLRLAETQALQEDWQKRQSTAPSNEDIDAQARAYLQRYEVDYQMALRIVIAAGTNPPPAPTPEQLQNSRPGERERLIRAAQRPADNPSAPQAGTASFAESVDIESAADAVAIMQGQAIEIFYAGRHQAMDGQEIIFTPADVQLMASNYDPKSVTAPLVIGHPDNNQPAYGWVKSLQATPDGRLLMIADQIHPSFAQSVKNGHFKKRSASFYAPGAYNNPAPRGWYLRHVGWLGAMQPAIKGLADVQFA